MVVLFGDAENLLDPGDVPHIRIVNLFRVEFFHLLFRNKAALVAESLLRQVLPTVVPHLLLGRTEVLFLPVGADFEKHESVLS